MTELWDKPKKCPSCGGTDLEDVGRYRVVNPNGEFVEGYGHAFVQVRSGSSWRCRSCGWYEGANLKRVNLKGEEIHGRIGRPADAQ